MSIALSWALPLIIGWLILRAAGQQGLLRLLKPTTIGRDAPRVAVIVPARNEEANIRRCLQSLVEQDYPRQRASILLVDDHSEDATASIAEAIARDAPALEVLQSPPLPPHWIGKSHACWIAACAAPTDAEWLCFLDADMRAEPELLKSAVAMALSEELDLLSLAPRHELGSFAERIIIPCGLYCLSFCRDLRKAQSRASADATVTGQFMLIRRSAYDAVGGHWAVRDAICEDVALARRIKRNGGHVLLCDGRELLSTRMYTGWSGLWPGLAKNLVEMLGGPLPTAAISLAAVALAWAAWLTPMVDGSNCADGATAACLAVAPAVAAFGAAFGLHLAGAAYFGIPLWYGLFFPIGYTIGAALAFDSIRRRWSRRVAWKGRIYS